MPIQTVLLTIAATLAGCLIALQAPINSAAAVRLGHPIAGAALSFTVGTIALLILTAVIARPHIQADALRTMAPYLLLGGGLLGAMYVTSNIVLTPIIGVAAVIALGIAGQVLASLLLDHFGALGLVTREITAGRLAGAVMVVTGALMVRFL